MRLAGPTGRKLYGGKHGLPFFSPFGGGGRGRENLTQAPCSRGTQPGAQRGAQSHNPEITSQPLHRLNHLGAPNPGCLLGKKNNSEGGPRSPEAELGSMEPPDGSGQAWWLLCASANSEQQCWEQLARPGPLLCMRACVCARVCTCVWGQ